MTAYAIPRTVTSADPLRGAEILLKALLVILLSFVVGWGALIISTRGSSVAGPATPPQVYDYSTLEADRAHLQYMSTESGSRMHMEGHPMWDRAQNPAYLHQMEAHMAEIDRMLGRAPNPGRQP